MAMVSVMRVCPHCRTTFTDDIRTCPHDGFRIVTRDVLDAAAHDPLLGATLAGRYTITGKLGAGGMGTVYRAEQAPLGREVALKVLRKELGRDPETVARFSREAKMLSQLRHPNTVAILDFGQSSEGLLYLAMELLEGEMLSSRLRREGALDVEVAARTAAGVLRSLDEAHARGIIHRDLKPDNIFLARVHGRPDDDEVVKVVDFGIAKIRDGEQPSGIDPVATQEGTVFGTPRYMSPEQAQGKSLDGRSDLYAVGVLLFHMLTGEPPFTDDDAVIVMAHHIKTVPLSVRMIVPERGIPESLDALVSKTLAKNPDDRSQTAQEFLNDLESLLGDIRASRDRKRLFTEETAIIELPKSPRPRRAWLGLSVVVSLLLFVVLAGATVLSKRPRATSARENVSTTAPVHTALRNHSVATPATVIVPSVSTPPVVTPMASPTLVDSAVIAHTTPPALMVRNRVVRHNPTQPIEPVVIPQQVQPRRTHRQNQPYQTFEGM
jgi:eukaryotic-like serine/threonine-protein kinase